MRRSISGRPPILIWKLLLLGIVIGSNNLATALALGALGQGHRRARVTLVFAAFEFTIPLIGLWLGRTAADWVEQNAGWIGPALLAMVGIWTISSGIRKQTDDERYVRRLTSWAGLMTLAALLSLDNLVIGFSLGTGDLPPLLVAATIALFSSVFTWTGMTLGTATRRHWERIGLVASGVLLLLVAGAAQFGWI